jgi:hypothetical protein
MVLKTIRSGQKQKLLPTPPILPFFGEGEGLLCMSIVGWVSQDPHRSSISRKLAARAN